MRCKSTITCYPCREEVQRRYQHSHKRGKKRNTNVIVASCACASDCSNSGKAIMYHDVVLQWPKSHVLHGNVAYAQAQVF